MNIEEQLRQIREEVLLYRLDESLLFLNRLLGVSRGYTEDPHLEPLVKNAQPPVLPHIVHLLARELLLCSSAVGHRVLDWEGYRRLAGQLIELEDPISHDPEWKHADPSGFFERQLAQQIEPQRRIGLKRYGLALGLFRDLEATEWPRPFNLRAELEAELKMPIETFMAMGHLSFALRTAKPQGTECLGTFTHMIFAEAFRLGFEFCVPEIWRDFLDRVGTDREKFRETAAGPKYAINDPRLLQRHRVNLSPALFEQYGLNALFDFPVVDLGGGRHVSVDPELLIDRVTFGLLSDLFDRDGLSDCDRRILANDFGHAFERFVGHLLGSVCSADRLWSVAEWEKSAPKRKDGQKITDWIFRGDGCNVLFECKTMRPSMPLRTYGTEETLQSLYGRIAGAVEQVSAHAGDISKGRWRSFGLMGKKAVGVIVTYGKIYTANGPFVRKRVQEILEAKRVRAIPYVVLSLEDLDSFVRLVEIGHSLEELASALAADVDSFEPLFAYQDELKERAVSTFSVAKGQAFLDGVSPRTRDRAIA